MSRWRPERAELWLELPSGGTLPRALVVTQACADFEHRLDALTPPRGAHLSCLVVDELVRYCVVPWNAQASQAVARQHFAVHCFRECYGDIANDWTVRVDSARYGASVLACAIDTVLLDRVVAMAAQRGLVLSAVQPALMRFFNAQRARIEVPSFWFVVRGRVAVTLLLVVQGEPVLVKAVSNDLPGLERTLSREGFSLGMELAACPVIMADEAGRGEHDSLREAA